MDDNSRDDLKQILARLSALDEKLSGVEQRLSKLEEPADSAAESTEAVASPTAELPQAPPPVVPLPVAPFSAAPELPIPPPVQEPASPPAPPEPPAPPASNETPAAERAIQKAHRLQQAMAEFHPAPRVHAKPTESLEFKIATYWLPRIGLLFLALVCILFAREHARGPLGKVLIAYAGSAALIIFGLWKDRKYPGWARPVLAGGLAFSYFASYAMGFVEPMRLLDSLPVKLSVLGVNLALIFGVAHWKKSEVIGGTALLLGYLTTGVVGNDTAAFGSSVALSVAAVLFLWINKWFRASMLAVCATYLAHFYVWRALPEAHPRSAYESFWFHFTYLSLYFVVFASAGMVGAGAARQELSDGRREKLNLLTLTTQVNVAGYVAGLVTVLKLTGIYWEQAWMVFFPVAAVLALLGLLQRGMVQVQTVYLVGCIFCLSLAIMSLASPKWLPIFLAVQALAVLWRRHGRYAEEWALLALAVLAYAVAYLISGGQIDALGLSHGSRGMFPWWTHASVATIMLLFALRWQKVLPLRPDWKIPPVAAAISLGAALVWMTVNRKGQSADFALYQAAAVPLGALLAVGFRSGVLLPFVFFTALASGFNFRGFYLIEHGPLWYGRALAGISLVGFLSGIITEVHGLRHRTYSRVQWIIVYLWAAEAACAAVTALCNPEGILIGLAAVFALLQAAAWVMRSGAVGKAGYVALPFMIVQLVRPYNIPLAPTLGAVGLMMIASYPVALPRWRYRTGDSQPALNRWGQALVQLVAGLAVIAAFNSRFENASTVAIIGAWAVVCALYGIAGRFKSSAAVIVVLGGASLALLVLLLINPRHNDEWLQMHRAVWAVAGVFMLVLAERLIRSPVRFRMRGANKEHDWLSGVQKIRFSATMAIMTLTGCVLALRALPEMRLFYFTGAMVAAAFIWIVFGFLFNEAAYRKSGFALLCLGIVKGLVYDVLSLKETFYRIVSWSILGTLAIAASFLYTRFRGRLQPTDSNNPEAPSRLL